jgi:hypothetical protein
VTRRNQFASGIVKIPSSLFFGVRMSSESIQVNWLKRITLSVLGGALLLVGVAMIVLPGPAIIFIPAGLALLAVEYDFARNWLLRMRRWLSSRARRRRMPELH